MRKKEGMGRIFSIILLLILVALIIALIILLEHNGSFENNDDANQEPQTVYDYGGEINICFTLTDNCEEFLMDYLRGSINPKCALYDINLENLTRLLLERNITTVTEDSTYDGKFITFKSYGLMHNKFCYDNGSVITGSMNPTYNDAYRNNNNLIIINSEHLAKNYADKEGELLAGINGKGSKVRYPIVIYNNKTIIKNYFCPDDDCNTKVLTELQKANHSIYFMTFSFTDDLLGDYLVMHKDRLDIKGIFEKQQLSNYSEYEKMNQSGMDVRIDKNKYKLHHKVFIIDNITVITGSYNPTSSADSRNDENILIITDKDIAQRYLEEFERLW